MAETDEAPQPSAPDDDEALRRRLLHRVAVAGVVVVALLGGLFLFDTLYVTPPQPPARIAAVAPPVAPEPTPEEVLPEKTEPVEEKAATGQEAAPAEAAAEPERSAAPSGLLPPPLKPERPLTVPAQGRHAHMRPLDLLPVPQKPEPAKEIAKVPPPPAAVPPPASHPIARAVEASRQFLLQMGVFSNVANAEELRAKLELAGVPTQVEARVQVGPFATRQEAEAARDKLKDLGMAPGLVVAVRK